MTTREEVLGAFGPPGEEMELEGGREVLTYVATTHTDIEVGVLLLLRWEEEVDTISRHRFEFKNGVLVRHWAEKAP